MLKKDSNDRQGCHPHIARSKIIHIVTQSLYVIKIKNNGTSEAKSVYVFRNEKKILAIILLSAYVIVKIHNYVPISV